MPAPHPAARPGIHGRRRALKSLASLALAGGGLRGATTRRAVAREPEAAGHVELQAGDLTAVVGDNSAHDQHRAGYNGLWSLRHAADDRSIFVPSLAGLNLEHVVTGEHLEDARTFFEPRNAPMTLHRLDDAAAELHQPPTPTFHVESWTTFRLVAPHFLDMDFRFRPHRSVFPRGYVSLFWASYMNAPEDKSMYFLGGAEQQAGQWTQLCTQWHNDQSTVRHRDDRLEMTFPEGGRPALFKSVSQLRFDEPLFYGHCDDLVWSVFFDRTDGIRLTHSPSGGGMNPERRTTNPAWDFQFFVREPEVMKEYGFRTRTLLRPRCSRDEILADYSLWNQTRRDS